MTLLLAAVAPCQTPSPSPATGQEVKEMTTTEAPALFKARVNVVMIPVVVRDKSGRAIATYTKDDFQLFDRGKLQEITRFTLEKSGEKGAQAAKTASAITPLEEPGAPPPTEIAERFVAYLFDDVHLDFGNLARARDAAGRQIAAMKSTERAALYTTSGRMQQDFTNEVDKLQAALTHLAPAPLTAIGVQECPDMDYYMADMIFNHNDGIAIKAAKDETQKCAPSLSGSQATDSEDRAEAWVKNMASRLVVGGRHESQVSLTLLQEVVRRMSVMPGQRVIVLVSPGFLTPEELERKSDVIDRAIKANVIINSLDARGLWTNPSFEASAPNHYSPLYAQVKRDYDLAAANAQLTVLAEVAYGTGGSLFQNNNDIDEGMRRLAATPEYYYLLGFSPQNLKFDGAYHELKVVLKSPPGGADLQARKGYYSPRKLTSAQDQMEEEIREALFSREELSDLPIELHTQYFKANQKEATIAVICRIDAHQIQFRKADGRNNDQLVIVSALFDRDGNMVSGLQKTVDMKLKDESLAKLLATGGLTIKTNFSAAPGTYTVRVVVRESEGQLMSALNGAVSIQ